jgi:hypothetical protein
MDENGDLVGLWLYLLDGEEALASHRECEDVRQVLSKRGISGHNASLVFEFLQPVFTFDDLTDVRQMARMHPDSFTAAPTLEEVSSVTTNSVVKICSCSCRYFVKVATVLPALNGDPWDRRFRVQYGVPQEMRMGDAPHCPLCVDDEEEADCRCDDEWEDRLGWFEIKARHCYTVLPPQDVEEQASSEEDEVKEEGGAGDGDGDGDGETAARARKRRRD